ncbi:Glyoxalase/Bleomycin resistance protein/Dihydroxybiphenyl dioxygenase [Gymnopilus junonius]|uniref:Glyoxalase/Bleomycin resistance protein/Dihydroxybiphenyl dioxygenase n=1 Tax=Gymnopilus junonius TaxID=109634 RepID=A0A9P5TRP3_GYMJU|nr:Glyoxalase/Bleomycin resistance protein/Dihydroxybiphenyl dioxygenase [Gymnopilus junonius]
MPLHHLAVGVRDIDEMRDFYAAALKPLGYKVMMTYLDGKVVGMGAGYSPDFWLSHYHAREETALYDIPQEAEHIKKKTHIAFAASNRKQVRDFYNAAIAAGGKDNGKPGLRPEYFATYYGAFVLDPEGRNIEAVCLKPGFLAEPLGVTGWLTVASVLAAIGSGAAYYAGWV